MTVLPPGQYRRRGVAGVDSLVVFKEARTYNAITKQPRYCEKLKPVILSFCRALALKAQKLVSEVLAFIYCIAVCCLTNRPV